MKHFKLDEFRCKCCGELPSFAKENVEALVQVVLDPARERYGKPVCVNSGYRCTRHNAAVGGVANSQHMRGEAADICCSDNELLAKIIEENGHYDQLIRYMGQSGKIRFLHVSWKRNGQNRKMKFNK